MNGHGDPAHFKRRPMFATTSRFLLSAAVVFVVGASSALAQAPRPAESDTKTPYELQVVLHLADNPSLTDVFSDSLQRELKDSLQADFGDLVHVHVVREHPYLKDVLEKGLANALKAVQGRDGIKTHFVLIDFNGVDYEIQTCQYDGITGQPNPVIVVDRDRTVIVRKEKTRDREFVAKAAALLVERDFGLIASFPSWPQGKTKPQDVRLEFKGGALAALDRWVKKGDVFAVVQVPNGNGPSATIPNAIVQVQDSPKDGTCTGQLYWRYEVLGGGGNVSYRCVKLGTVSGPLRLRVVKASGPNNTLGPADAALELRRNGFSGENQTVLKADTRAGYFDSANPKLDLGAKGIFDKVAFVSVVEGAKAKASAEVPVPLLTDQPYLIKLTDKQDTNPIADLDKIAWMRNVNDTFGALEYVIQDIQKLAGKEGTRAEIIKKGQEGLDRARDDHPRLLARRDELFKTPTAADARDLKEMNGRLNSIKKRIDELNNFLLTQQEIEKQEKDPERLEWKAKIEQGKLLEKDLEYGRAIALYEKVPEKFAPKDLKGHIAELHKLWDTDDEKYREARAFIYEVFPHLKDAVALQARLGDAFRAFEECKRVKDVIASQKLLAGIGLVLPRLAKEGEELNPRLRQDDEVQAKRLQAVGAELEKLLNDVKSYLERQKATTNP
jgi:hypothetical protein